MAHGSKATIAGLDLAIPQVRYKSFLLKLTEAGGIKPTPIVPKPVTRDDLSHAAQAILGMECDGDDCCDSQPLCPPDPRVTCQLVSTVDGDWVKGIVHLPWRIANAKKGDLILCPASNAGMIGHLLACLTPPQHFTHMGIMTKNCVEIRHATVCSEWLMAFPNGSIPFVGAQPTDGFEEDALRFGWPGTITQSIENAYNASVNPDYAPGKFEATVPDHENGGTKKASFLIAELSFNPIRTNIESNLEVAPNWQTFETVVVKPCPMLETDSIRHALRDIADECKQIRGHYRYHTYTDALDATDGKHLGPARLETEQPDPANPCGPPLPVKETVPLVCSSLPWLAVQNLNKRGRLPKLILDPGDVDPPDNLSPCASAVERHPEWDVRDPVHDGLYLYDEDQRRKAAKDFYEYLTKHVREEAASKVPGILKAAGYGLIGMAITLNYVAAGAAVLAAATGMSLEKADALINWLTDMPDDVANQLINAFASDDCSTAAKDSDLWKNPGEGRAVSPDNILRSWAAPQPERSDARRVLKGLYGFNVPVNIRPPRDFIRPITAWQVSPGPSGMQGIVSYQGRPLNGARVTVCCVQTMTKTHLLHETKLAQDGAYIMAPPAGNYMARAEFEDESGMLLETSQPVSLPFLGVARVDFDLQPPPVENRLVKVSGRMDLKNPHLIGKDWWDHPEFLAVPMRLGPYGIPGSPDWDKGHHDQTRVSCAIEDYGTANLQVTSEWQPAGAVKISFYATIFEDKDQKVHANEDGVVLAPGETRGWKIDLQAGGLAAPNAHIEFTVFNDQQP